VMVGLRSDRIQPQSGDGSRGLGSRRWQNCLRNEDRIGSIELSGKSRTSLLVYNEADACSSDPCALANPGVN
jgi:hypothetical protein